MMNFFRFLLPLLLLLLPHCLMAQQGNTDTPSIGQMVSDYENASNKQRRVLAPQIMQELIKEDVFYTPPPPIRSDMPVDTLDALVYYGVHCLAECINNYAKGIEYGEKAFPLLQDNYPFLYDAVLRGMTKCYQRKGDSQQALEWGKKAEEACKKHDDKRELSYTYSLLSSAFTTLKKPQMAADYALAAIDESHQSGDTIIINSYYLAACDAYVELGDYQKSIEYGWKAVDAAKNMQVGPAITANHLALLGYVYYRADSLATANKVLDEALRLFEEAKSSPVEFHGALEFKAMVLIKQNRVDDAVQLLRKGIQICKDAGDLRDESFIQHTLYEALRDKNPAGALEALERYTELRDSIYNEDLQQQLSNAEASYHNEQLKSENEAAEKRNRLILITSIIVALLLMGIIGMLIYAMRTRARSVKALQRLQRARERFFTNVTHEFRTPLTVIMGVANRLQRSISSNDGENATESAEQRKSLALIERNGEQLLTLVNQLLDVAKATSAIGDLKYQNGNLVAYTDMVVESFQEPAKAKGIELSFQPQEVELQTAFVADYMQKILSNLLTNALKFTSAKGKVTVGLKTENDRVLLTVSDTGQGIAPEDLPHIFEPFYQGDNSQMGTGVGLALVNQLVEAMEGTITVDSIQGQGTTFVVDLPVKEVKTDSQQKTSLDKQEDKDIAKEDASLSDTEVSKQEKDVVLVVEDNADVAEYIGSVLCEKYEVMYAANGAEGIERANEQMPDLIVTDIMMPDVDGLELCRRIRASEMTNHIPLVIITARVTDEDRLEGIKAGADAYLYKPFLADELLLRIEKLLESRKVLQQKFAATISVVPQQKETSSEPQTLYERNVAKANEVFLRRLDDVIGNLMPTGDCSANKVAEEMCMSRSQFARKIKAVIDTTPSDYILNYRLNEVKHLLHEQPPLPFLDIAIKCGFADNAHMTHVFKQKLGITPTQYMKETLDFRP